MDDFVRHELGMLILLLTCIMALPVMEFQVQDTKLERFLHKNQQNQRNLLNFENWTNGEPQWLAKIRVFKVDYFDFFVKKLKN